jgi:hypothetical protein
MACASNIYEGRKLGIFDLDQLIYFGMSVFWRGACRQWKTSTGAIAPAVDLGAYYEPIRQFLLGGPFPQNVHIIVLIHNMKPVGNAAVPVQQAKSGYGDFYWLYLNGLGFMLFLEDAFPGEAERLCAQHGVNGPIVVDRAFGNMVYSFLKELLQDGEKSDSVMSLAKVPRSKLPDIDR